MRSSWPASTAALWTLLAVLGTSEPQCPAPCTADPSEWTPYKSSETLKDCHHSVLLDFSSHDSLGSPDAAFTVRACTVEDNTDPPVDFAASRHFFLRMQPGSTMAQDDSSPRLRLIRFLLDRLQNVLTRSTNRGTRTMMWRLNTTSVGVYRGFAVDEAWAASVVESLKTQVDFKTSQAVAIQLCGDGRDIDHTFGIAVDATGQMTTVQHAMSSWDKAQCVAGDGALDIKDIPAIEEPMPELNQTRSEGLSTVFNCTTTTVMDGDTCTDLAERCEIPVKDFIRYNSAGETEEEMCMSLQPGQKVCCNGKGLGEDTPEMKEDGSCATYITEEGDTCFSIARKHNLETSDISYLNDGRTWGWSGCEVLHTGLGICLSRGYPPLPVPRAGAACGPTVPGTEMPMDETPLADLHPCPLNACCNTLGNCGVSPDFCIYEKGPTGNPGTAPPDRNGCISNCGLEILNNSIQPAEFLRIGYYESFNLHRPCLHLRAADIRVDDYTHIHWAFATIDRDFGIGVNDTHSQWADFLALTGVKRIITFGGYGSSVNWVPYDVIREALDPENVDQFIANILELVEDNGLDGVDFDWEYPVVSVVYQGTAFAQTCQASDMSPVPLRSMADGPNYLAFLEKLRKALPPDKTISIAAPATYWHLRGFPIEEMWPHVDYIVYMTYDLHGQWDYEKLFIQGSCEGRNCLRSHVTKAGVPRNVIAVGVASYGRAFGMTDADCTGPECRFEGPQTAAIPGACTGTPGILAIAEIEALMIEGDINKVYYDPGSDSNILVYNDTQWVAFMSQSTMRRRVEYYRNLNFGGYANWAIDLMH
ncbi:glycoside hydrolase superfamily [Aspergillus aurantiobrunneus]